MRACIFWASFFWAFFGRWLGIPDSLFLFPLISYRVLIVFPLIGGDSRQDKGIPSLVSRGGDLCDDTASVDGGRTKG